jgi:hypothetical protein
MDFTNFEKAAEQGAILELKDPAGNRLKQEDGSPVTIQLAGVTSPRWTRATDALQNRVMNSKEKRDANDIRMDRCGLLAAATLGWSGIEVDGQKLEFSTSVAQKFYARFRWVADQVDEFVAAKENFLPASSSNS